MHVCVAVKELTTSPSSKGQPPLSGFDAGTRRAQKCVPGVRARPCRRMAVHGSSWDVSRRGMYSRIVHPQGLPATFVLFTKCETFGNSLGAYITVRMYAAC
jgi:hypothetical protein